MITLHILLQDEKLLTFLPVDTDYQISTDTMGFDHLKPFNVTS